MPKTTRTMRLTLACGAPIFGIVACFPESTELEGSCEVVPNSVLDCRVEGYEEDVLVRSTLVAYACTGSARPDLDRHYEDGVPSGLLCADKPALATGERTYCCTDAPVTCAYDPSMECEPDYTGYECFGNNRPESLNPSLLCSNGTSERGLYHYCCSGQAGESPCDEDTNVECPTSLIGFSCTGSTRPTGKDYGPNRSRADYFYPLCSVALPQINPRISGYCCYMPLVVPVGGTCVQHPYVPGCEAGRFGFACYGPDGPEEDYPPMECPDPGVPGVSAEGYEATLYCCDFI
jgi:hypothetical protein